MPPIAHSAPTNILLFCDSAKLARAIEFTLQANGHFQTALIDRPGPWPIDACDWNLVVIALTEPCTESLVVVSQAKLTQWIGRRPILIITPHPFASQPDELIWCLEFPFGAQTLSNCVAEILSATPVDLQAPTAAALPARK